MFRIIVFTFFLGIITSTVLLADTGIEKPLTSNHKQLTSVRCMKGYPEWSLDGKYLLYSSMQDAREGEETELFRVPADGGESVKITQGGGHHGVYSPDGKYIAFDRDFGMTVQIMSTDGGVPIRVVPETIPVENSGNPCWSPDGTQIAFRSFEDLYTLELTSGKFTRVYNGNGGKPMPIHWLKSKNAILIARVIPDKLRSDLWMVYLDSGEAKQMTFSDSFVNQACVSPDEEYMIFAQPDADRNHYFYIMPVEGGTPFQLIGEPGYYEPCWSPDGKRIAYASRKTGAPEIWVMEIDLEEVVKKVKELNP